LQPKHTRILLDIIETCSTDEQIRYLGMGVAYDFQAHLAGYESDKRVTVLKKIAGVR
jgi:hypothetical protein